MISFVLYMVFIASYFLHLTARVPALGAMRFDLVLMAAVFAVALVEKRELQKKIGESSPAKALLAFIAFTVVTLPIVEWPGSVLRHGFEEFFKVASFFFATLFIIDTRGKLKAFIALFLFCTLFRVLEPGYLHYTTGYWGDVAFSTVGYGFHALDRLSGAPHDVINPNQLAWVAVGLVPFMYYFARHGGFWTRAAVLAAVPLVTYSFILTGSRSGLLSLMVVFLAIVFIGRGKTKRAILLAIALLPVALVTSERISDDLKERYVSIIDDGVVGHDTAMARIEGTKRALSTIFNKPVAGHGLGTSKEVSANLLSGRAQVAHNLYVETLQEVGIGGFIIFFTFVALVIGELLRAKAALAASQNNDRFLVTMASATLAWCVMDLFYSLSCFGLNSWEWYLFGGIATVTRSLAVAAPGVTSMEGKVSRAIAFTRTA